MTEKILIKAQNQSDAIKGVIYTFMHLYEGPYTINKILPNSAYELVDDKGKVKGEFNKKQLKPYRTKSDPNTRQAKEDIRAKDTLKKTPLA